MAEQTIDGLPAEREGTRIRAFLSKIRPLTGCTFGDRDEYWEARALVEQLALSYDVQTDDYHWDAMQCATVVDFLSWVEPVKGTCFCNDEIEELGINTTCGFHAILQFAADEMRRIGRSKSRRREEAHG
jgi:hypothetical protein